jgi:hypothetical protein
MRVGRWHSESREREHWEVRRGKSEGREFKTLRRNI